MTAASELLRLVADHGIEIVRGRERLRVRPASVVSPALFKRLAAARDGLLRVVPEVDETPEAIAWRVEAMLAQVPMRGPIIGILTAREGAWPADGGHWVSCGDPLPPDGPRGGPFGVPVRCEPCYAAVRTAIGRRRAAR